MLEDIGFAEMYSHVTSQECRNNELVKMQPPGEAEKYGPNFDAASDSKPAAADGFASKNDSI